MTSSRWFAAAGVMLGILASVTTGLMYGKSRETVVPIRVEATTRVPNTSGPMFPTTYRQDGMTRRQLYAAMAMQGFCAHGMSREPSVFRDDAILSWQIADALIATENE